MPISIRSSWRFSSGKIRV